MMVDNHGITEDQFNILGDIQARTAVIAKTFEDKTECRDKILTGFSGRDGKLDMNGIMFAPDQTAETVFNKFDAFIGDIGIENADDLLAEMTDFNNKAKGMHEKAATAGVILKLSSWMAIVMLNKRLLKVH